jgi:hypothetical protein
MCNERGNSEDAAYMTCRSWIVTERKLQDLGERSIEMCSDLQRTGCVSDESK